jgi:hypothetical protein
MTVCVVQLNAMTRNVRNTRITKTDRGENLVLNETWSPQRLAPRPGANEG